jgi:hypothetical protein
VKSDGTDRQAVHDFFENPKGAAAVGFQALIMVLILLSVSLALVEFFFEEVFAKYAQIIVPLDHVILAVFTVEYLLRVLSAPRKVWYVTRPLNIVDFLAIFPSYLEIILRLSVDYSVMGLRGLRILRFLRFSRLIRGLRLLKFFKMFRRVFQYEGTILQAITPMLLLGIVLKGIIWVLESQGLWISTSSLGDLFTIIGFALGIILSQKIGVTYDKFTQVQDASVRIYGGLQTLRLVINGFKPGEGTRVCGEWAGAFLKILEDPEADNYSLHKYNESLYRPIAECERIVPDQFWSLHVQLCSDASYCLSKKLRLTPKAYDLLLHQATVIYLVLIAMFIPGGTGMISVLMATYILYGMYHLTQDLDSIVGGEYNLINIDLSELKYFAQECRQKANPQA